MCGAEQTAPREQIKVTSYRNERWMLAYAAAHSAGCEPALDTRRQNFHLRQVVSASPGVHQASELARCRFKAGRVPAARPLLTHARRRASAESQANFLYGITHTALTLFPEVAYV